MNVDVGKYMIAIGALILAMGVVVYFFGDKLNFFGRLPGDIRVEKENFKLYFPLTTMIIISLAITILINILKKLF